jgi:hypothetical protein
MSACQERQGNEAMAHTMESGCNTAQVRPIRASNRFVRTRACMHAPSTVLGRACATLSSWARGSR